MSDIHDPLQMAVVGVDVAKDNADTIEALRAELETVNLEAKVYAIAATEHGEMRLAAEARAEAAESANAALVVAGQSVVDAVNERHDSKEPPLKYTVPWSAVTALRTALSNAPAQAKLMAAVVEAAEAETLAENEVATEGEIGSIETYDAAMDRHKFARKARRAAVAALRGSDQP